MKNVYLIGMMGSGKTTTGRALAKLLAASFIDLDERIVQKAGRSINDIFKLEGEASFRKQENEALSNVLTLENQVVATGGGIVIHPENRMRLKRAGAVIYLKANLDTLWQRVERKTDRPLLAVDRPREMFAQLFKTREPFYKEAAECVIMTDGKSPETVAKEIYETWFHEKNKSKS